MKKQTTLPTRATLPSLAALCMATALILPPPARSQQPTHQPTQQPTQKPTQIPIQKPTQKPPPAPTIDLLDDDVVEMSTFNVTETRTRGYDSRYTTSGLRTSQELKNLPNSLSVINSTFINDLGALDTGEMSKWFVTGESNPDPENADRPLFRGVQSNYAMRNGWIWYSGIDSYSIDRVELVRGPNAFLYGESDVGGVNNTITKQALFKDNTLRIRLTAGSYDLYRAEFDTNQVINRYVAIRAAGVYSKNGEWYADGGKEFMGLYLATTIRPTRTTTIRINAEVNSNDRYISTGLFADGYSYYDNGSRPYAQAAKYSTGSYYTPADGKFLYNARAITTMKYTGGNGLAITDTSIIPNDWQVKGPDSHSYAKQASISIEIEQKLTEKLSLMLSGNLYQRSTDEWLTTGKTIYRDINPTLPDGTPNTRYNQLYTEYYRQHQLGGNIVRDMRASLVYNWDTLSWMQQQFVFNAQQHQDNPGQKDPKLAEFLDPSAWTPGDKTIFDNNQAANPAAMSAIYTAFSNNRFYRRYYIPDGDSPSFTNSTAAIPGTSAYYPGYGATNAQTSTSGSVLTRRIYTPSYGIGAAGTYFDGHLFTLLGYRKDNYHMNNTYGAPEVYSDPDSWNIRPYDDGSGQAYTNYSQISRNAGVVLRYNDHLAINYNYGQSTRLSLGDGRDGLFYGTKQGLSTGAGSEYGIRFAFNDDNIVANIVYYDNYQPNDRVTLSMNDTLLSALNAQYPDLINPSTDARGDTQELTTSGVEFELTANITQNWRLLFNFASNKMTATNRVPQLHAVYDMVINDPAFTQDPSMQWVVTDLQNLLVRYPEGAPLGGYTKFRANLYTRYDFRDGSLKGLFVAGGANWRDKTYCGTVNMNYNKPDETATDTWTPSYTTVSISAGYTTRLFDRRVIFQLNIDNLFDKEYYRAASVGSGSWGNPRTFKFITSIDL